MPDTAPTAEMLARWAIEQQWDWRVRALCAGICIAAALVALFIYLRWGRSAEDGVSSRARTFLGRLSVSCFVVTVAEAGFFRDSVATVLLAVTALVIGVIGLRMPKGDSR